MNPSHVQAYWYAEQDRLLSESENRAPGLTLPIEFVGVINEQPCPIPGCPGTLHEEERIVKSVDEASQDVMRCSQRGCGYIVRK